LLRGFEDKKRWIEARKSVPLLVQTNGFGVRGFGAGVDGGFRRRTGTSRVSENVTNLTIRTLGRDEFKFASGPSPGWTYDRI